MWYFETTIDDRCIVLIERLDCQAIEMLHVPQMQLAVSRTCDDV